MDKKQKNRISAALWNPNLIADPAYHLMKG